MAPLKTFVNAFSARGSIRTQKTLFLKTLFFSTSDVAEGSFHFKLRDDHLATHLNDQRRGFGFYFPF